MGKAAYVYLHPMIAWHMYTHVNRFN
jgi:hypothetical protein